MANPFDDPNFGLAPAPPGAAQNPFDDPNFGAQPRPIGGRTGTTLRDIQHAIDPVNVIRNVASGVFGKSVVSPAERPPEPVPVPPPAETPAPVTPYMPGPRRSNGEAALHNANQYFGGVNEGLLDFAHNIHPLRNMAVPVETVLSTISSAFGGPSVSPVTDAFESFHGAAKKYVAGNTGDPESGTGYVMRKSGHMTGATLPMTAGMLVAGPAHVARQSLQSAVPPTSTVSAIVDTLLRSVAANPGKTILGDVIGATAGGAAGGAADLQSPTGQASPGVRALVEAAGGMAPLATPMATFSRAGRDVGAAVRGEDSTIGRLFGRGREAVRDVAERKAGSFVADQMTANAPEVARVQSVTADVPGFQPTKPQQANTDSMLRTQSRIEGGLSGKELDTASGIYDQNVGAIQDKIRTAAPGVDSPEAVASAMERRVADLEARLAASEAAAKAKLEATQGALPTESPRPGTDDKLYDPKAAGSVLRSERGVIKDKLNRDTAALKAAVDPEGRLSVPAEDLRVAVQADLDGRGNALTGAPDEPALLKKLLGPKGDTPETATFGDIQDYRSDVQRRIREMGAAAQPDYTKIEQLRGVVSRIDESVKAGAAKAGDPEIAKRYDQFREFYKDEVAPRTQQGVSGQMDRRTPRGDLKVNDEDLPKKFFAPNSLTEAEQFQKLYGHNAPAVEAMKDHALASLRDSAPGGKLTQAHIDKWKAQHARVLDRVPEVRDAVGKVTVADAEKALATVDARRQMVQDSDLAKRVGGDPAKTVKDAIDDPKLMRSLRRTVGSDSDAQAALKRMVWKHVAGDGKELPPLEAISKVLDSPANRASLEIAGITRDDLKNLKTIRDAIEIQGRVERPVGRGADSKSEGAAAKFKDVTGSDPNVLANRAVTIARGRSSASYEIGGGVLAFMKNLSEKQSDALMKRMLWDGRLAADVAQGIQSGKMKPDTFRRLNSYLLTIPGENKEKK